MSITEVTSNFCVNVAVVKQEQEAVLAQLNVDKEDLLNQLKSLFVDSVFVCLFVCLHACSYLLV